MLKRRHGTPDYSADCQFPCFFDYPQSLLENHPSVVRHLSFPQVVDLVVPHDESLSLLIRAEPPFETGFLRFLSIGGIECANYFSDIHQPFELLHGHHDRHCTSYGC